MKTKLSICYPVFRDFDGLYFSSLDIPLTHSEVLDDVEIVVVDNDPDSPSGKDAKKWVEGHLAGTIRARYIAAPGPGGPAIAKQRCVDEAAYPYVLVMDSHVRVIKGAIAKLMDYYTQHPDTIDILSGPMFYDQHAAAAVQGKPIPHAATHMDPVWRGENLGIWATDPRGVEFDSPPFDVPAMGCGLFSTRKEAFVGFNPNFRGFGGEEYYIHEKTRQHGGKAICLPFLRWVHRFGRPLGVPYTLIRWDKVRNHVIGHQELGLPLDGIFKHFVEGRLMSEAEWTLMLTDPVGLTLDKAKSQTQPHAAGCNTCGKGKQKLDESVTLEMIYEGSTKVKSDINEHLPKLRELASQSKVVVEFGPRRNNTTTALLAGQPEMLVCYSPSPDGFFEVLKDRQGKTNLQYVQGEGPSVTIPECDMLFEDTTHTAEFVYKLVTAHASRVRRWMVFHDTQIYGEMGEGRNTPGILPALRRFMRENPEWSVIYHSAENNGLTVLSRSGEDKPPLPSILKMGWNYAKAIAKHQATGARLATEETMNARLDRCSICPQRTENRCSVCGCFLDVGPNDREGKVMWADSECPLGYWTREPKAEDVPSALEVATEPVTPEEEVAQ